MGKNDWEDLGEQLSDLVNNAVSGKDYSSLNENINQVLENAIDSGSDALRNILKGAFGQSGEDLKHGRAASSHMGSSGIKSSGTKSSGSGASYGNSPSGEYRRTGGGGYETRSGHTYRQSSSQESGAGQVGKYYASLNEPFLGGGVQTIVGASLLLRGVTKIGSIWRIFSGGFIWPGILMLGGGYLLYRGVTTLSMIRRFRKYQDVLGTKTYASMADLAKAVGKDVGFVGREVKEMIDRGWFPQGHLDADGTTLMVSNELFDTYLSLRASRAEQASQVEQERQQVHQQAQRAASTAQEEKSKESSKETSKADARVQEVLQKGEEYLAQLKACNREIPGEEMTVKISRMEELVYRILDRAKEHPEIVTDLKKMLQYYLPTTVKLLRAYIDMDKQPVAGENIRSAKREIEQTIDTLNTAFEKLLDSIFQEQAWDVSSDISVLNTMLAQEGLAGDAFGDARRKNQATGTASGTAAFGGAAGAAAAAEEEIELKF